MSSASINAKGRMLSLWVTTCLVFAAPPSPLCAANVALSLTRVAGRVNGLSRGDHLHPVDALDLIEILVVEIAEPCNDLVGPAWRVEFLFDRLLVGELVEEGRDHTTF